jgi:hypothetical protein
MMRRINLWIGIGIAALLLSACALGSGPISTSQPVESQAVSSPVASQTPTASPLPPTETPTPSPVPSATPTITPTPLPQSVGPGNFPSGVNPLTGLPVADPALLERRPVSVKVQIFPRGQRPPWGISLADIVYDYYQNNGLTRFNAIFYGNDAQQVGPVRSARYFDDNILRMYKAIFAFGGADRRVLDRLFSADYYDRLVVEGSSSCPALCRIDPSGFNFLVANTQELGKLVAGKGVDNSHQNLDGMSFQYLPPPGGVPAQQIYNRYSISAYNRWDYDPATGRYLRFQDVQEDNTGKDEAYEPLTDRSTGAQVAADNVVVLFATHNPDEGSKTRIDINLAGSGQAVAFRDGQRYDVLWNRPTLDSVLYLTNPDGTPFPFKQGSTWFQVMGQYTKVAEPSPGVWRFENRLP